MHSTLDNPQVLTRTAISSRIVCNSAVLISYWVFDASYDCLVIGMSRMDVRSQVPTNANFNNSISDMAL